MKVRGYAWLLTAIAVVAMAVPAFAQKVETGAVDYPPGALVNCDLTGYKSFIQVLTPPVAIPDASPAGVTVGPIVTPGDGSLIQDVILDLRATHTWVGDLIVTLTYDADCSAATANVSQRILCRPRGLDANAPTPCGTGTGFGCNGDLSSNNTELFTDGIGTPLAEGVCPTPIPSGCFRPSTVGGGSFAAFNGLPKGGCWTLNVSDNAAADIGTIAQWSVHILNSPTPNTASSWGSVKTLYR